MNETARPPVAAAAVGVVLILATADQGGSGARATLAVHLAVALLVAASVLGLPRAAGRVPTAVSAAFAALAAIVAAGALVAPYGYAALSTLLEFAAFVGSAWFAARSGPDLVASLRPWLLTAGAVHGIHAAWGALRGEVRPPSTFFNPNHAGAWLGAILLLGAFSRPRTRTGRILKLVALLPILAGFFLAGSRGALLGVAVGFAAGFLSIRGDADRRTRRILGIAGILVTVVASGLLVHRFRAGDPFAFQRLRIWRASIAAFLDHPWSGTGPGQFASAAPNLNFALDDGPLRYPRSFATPHSDLLRAPCELGWPGAIAVAAIAIASVRALRRRARERPLDAGAVAALAALAAQAAVEDLSSRPAVHLLFAVLAGTTLAEATPLRARSMPGFRFVAAFVLVLAAGIAEVGPYRAWILTRALPRGPLTVEGRARLDEALGRNPLHPDLWLRRAEDVAASGAFDLERYAAAREAAERAIRLHPDDATFRRALARLEARACLELFRDERTRERAVGAYADAESRARHDPFIPIEAAGFQLETGDLDGARRSAERALRIEPNAIPPRILLAGVALGGRDPGGPARARELLDEARAMERAFTAAARESVYARALLVVDPMQIAPIERRLSIGAPPRP